MADSSLGAVAELLKLFTGKGNYTTTKESTSGFTETTQKGLPPEAMQALIKTAMEGNQGLASVASGQKAAGLYNSSTNQLLVNDLLARITGQAATLGAPTTVTRTPTNRTVTQTQSTPALGKSLPALAAMSLGKGGIDQLLGYGSKANSLYNKGKDMFDWLTAPGAAELASNAATSFADAASLASQSYNPSSMLGGLLADSPQSSPMVYDALSSMNVGDAVSSLFSYPSVEAVNAGGELAFTSAESAYDSLAPLSQFDSLAERGITATGESVRSFKASLEDPRLPSFSEYLSSPDATYLRDTGATVDQLIDAYGVPFTAAEQGILNGTSSLFAPTSSEAFIDAYGLGGGMFEAVGSGSTLFSPTATESWIDAGGLGADALASSSFLTGPAAEAGSSLFAATATEAAIDAGALGGAAAAETAGAAGLSSALGPAGLVMNAGTILPAIGKVITGWVICTELNSTGELSDTLYQATSPHFSRMHPDTIRGYQWWAIPYVKLMRKHSIFRSVVRPWAIGRARYLSGESSFLGWITVAVGEPICFLLGKTVARQAQNYEVLYGR